MTGDQDMVSQFRHSLKSSWYPNGRCQYHTSTECCLYNGRKQLIELHLCGLRLVEIPSEVRKFASLQWLYLIRNRLTSLPAEVSRLSSLRMLNLSGNQFTSLPAEVGQLSSLQELDLSNNQLTSLSAEVSQLSSLRQLILSNNQLTSLPAEVGQLSSLQILDLRNNQLTSLPTEVGQLQSLFMLGLDNNPLQSPPPDIVAQGQTAILAYIRTQLPPMQMYSEVSGATVPAKESILSVASHPITIFYCYAHEDRNLRDRIDAHLGVLKRSGQVTGWYDREIQAGTEWERGIEKHLSTANIILLLVSADFVNSDYCYGVEMQKALEMHAQGKAHVLPILLRPVDWQNAPFARLQILPTGAMPITRWPDPEEALEDVARQIRTVVNTLRTHKG